MTREEAIEVLKANYPSKCFEQLREAVDMAIEALEQEPCEDAISRQAVINTIYDNKSDFKNDFTQGFFADKIRALPPVKPQLKTGCEGCIYEERELTQHIHVVTVVDAIRISTRRKMRMNNEYNKQNNDKSTRKLF